MEKDKVWYPSEKEGWAQGTLVDNNDAEKTKVKTSEGQVRRRVSPPQIFLANNCNFCNIITSLFCGFESGILGWEQSLCRLSSSSSSPLSPSSPTRFSFLIPIAQEFTNDVLGD